MIVRTFDTKLINGILNDPSVFPMVTMDKFDYLDMSPIVNEDNHFLLIYDGDNLVGLVLLQKIVNGIYEQHTGMLPAGRGRVALRLFEELKEYMQGWVKTVMTMVPIDNKPADWITRKVGFKFLEERTIGFIRNGVDVPLKIYSMEIK